MSGIPVRGQAKGSADAAFAAARKRGCQRLDFTRDYFTALYRDAATLGIDADVLVGQWSLETGDGTSTYWIEDGNPGGLAAFDDGSNWGLTFSPEKAARAHAVHMARYLGSTNVPDDWIATDARWQAVADAGYVGTVTTSDDLGNGRWATDPQYASKLRSRYVAYWREPGTTPVQPAGGTDVAITFGNVPIFGHTDRYISDKREGFGWDNLGKRNPKFITLHRMVGSLTGTDGWFRRSDVSSITDYGVGIQAVDGAKAGHIYRWNDPTGHRSGWSSGPVSAPFGDGALIVAKYGINAVNRDDISLEISGTDEPIDDFSWGEIVHFCAWWIDRMKIPYTALPKNPHTGINVLIWHTEFTAGTGKQCPFPWMRSKTEQLYTDVAAFLKPYQEGEKTDTGTTPAPDLIVEPVPEPEYVSPVPVLQLSTLGQQDADTAKSLVVEGATNFIFVNDRVRAIRNTPRYQRAIINGPRIGPDIEEGEEFEVLWHFVEEDGTPWYLTPWWSRVLANDTQRIQD